MNQIDEMIRESILDDDDALLKAVEQAEHTFSEQFYEGLEALPVSYTHLTLPTILRV